jgi:hypothetical protein
VAAPLANSPCLAFGHPALFSLRFLMWPPLFPNLLALHLATPTPFHYDSLFGYLSCKLTLCCVWAPILDQAVLKKLSRSQNFFLSDIPLVFLPSAPLCGPFSSFHVGGHTSCQLSLCCVWALCLVFVTIPLLHAPLTNSPCPSFGNPALFSLRLLMWLPLLPTHLALCLVSLPPLHYDSSCGNPSCKLTLYCVWAHNLSQATLKKLS